MSARSLGLIFALHALIADQISKFFMIELLLNPPREIILTSFFKLVPVWNHGVSFGMFPADSIGEKYFLVAVALAITAYVAYWLWGERDKISAAGLGLIIGGAIGNVIDRLRFGAVKDFFTLHYESWAWPSFNIADSCIVIGVTLLIVRSVLYPSSRNSHKVG